MNWENYIDRLTENYDLYIERFLNDLHACPYNELKTHIESFLAITYTLVRHNDGKSVEAAMSYFLKFFCDLSFDRIEDIGQFDSKYGCSGLTPVGLAIKLNALNVLPLLLKAFEDNRPYLAHNRYHNCFDFMAANRLLDSEDTLTVLVENGVELSGDVLYYLVATERTEFAKKLISKATKFDCFYGDSIYGLIKDIEKNEFGMSFLASIAWDYELEIPDDKHKQNEQRVVQLLKDEALKSDVVACEEKIIEIQSNEDTRIQVITTNGVYIAEIADFQDCCEIYGGYIICEDNISSYIGANLLGIYLTDVCCDTKGEDIVENINYMQNRHNSCYYHNIQFINFRTTKGLLQFVVYNCHNGYYGHDISVRKDGVVIWSDRL